MNFTVITSVNNNNTYKGFVESSVKMWNNFGFKVKIGVIQDETDYDKEFDKIIRQENLNAELIKFKHIKKIDTGCQAKVTRMYLASLEENFIITDLDLYVLNFGKLKSWLNNYDGNNILAIGGDMYSGKSKGKFPMYYTSGSGESLRKIINPNNLSYKELLSSWKKLKPEYDGKESLGNTFSNFSDESLLRRLIQNSPHKNKITHINRLKQSNKKDYENNVKRIDRHWNWKLNKDKLYNGEYIDCFPKRPLNKKDPTIQEIFKYLKIN